MTHAAFISVINYRSRAFAPLWWMWADELCDVAIPDPLVYRQPDGRNVSNIVDNSVGESVNKTEICCRYAALAYHEFRLDVYVHAIVQSINCYVACLIIISFSGCYARQVQIDSHTYKINNYYQWHYCILICLTLPGFLPLHIRRCRISIELYLCHVHWGTTTSSLFVQVVTLDYVSCQFGCWRMQHTIMK